MDSDEDFVVAPSKKVKKNAGEEKGGKKKKTSESKGERTDTSPKRKTPARKKEKEEGKEAKKPKAKAKPKKKGGDDDEEEEEKETEAPEGYGEDGEDGDNYEPDKMDRLQVPVSESEAELSDSSATKGKKKKEKKETKKGGKKGGSMDSDQIEILEYLKKQNRPYSVINIFDNLHGKIKKAACQKALDSLVDEGELQAKEFGKAKIYLLNQQNIPEVSAKDMDKLKEDLNDIKKEHTKLTEEVKEMNTYLKNLNNQLTNEQLTDEIAKYESLTQDLTKKLEVYESGNYPKISDEEMKAIEEKKKKMETEYKKRKRMCMEMLRTMADSMDQKLATLIEMVGVEED